MTTLTLLPGSLLSCEAACETFDVDTLVVRTRWGDLGVGEAALPGTIGIRAKKVGIVSEMREPLVLERLKNLMSGVGGVEEFAWNGTNGPPWPEHPTFVVSSRWEAINLANWTTLRVIRARFHYIDSVSFENTLKTACHLRGLEQTELEILVRDHLGSYPSGIVGVWCMQQSLRAVVVMGGALKLCWTQVTSSKMDDTGARVREACGEVSDAVYNSFPERVKVVYKKVWENAVSQWEWSGGMI
ncbi:hypothetical protein BDZ89DRAFT_1048846 [Hymenopellis radicata]|nr:hypothetical protein BDZ89DRAFT_1048846 [Hymenopellis radicata]